MKVDFMKVDFMKSWSCKNWSRGGWSHESWSHESWSHVSKSHTCVGCYSGSIPHSSYSVQTDKQILRLIPRLTQNLSKQAELSITVSHLQWLLDTQKGGGGNVSIVLLLSIEAKLGVHCTHKGLTHASFTFTLHKVCPERPIKGLILL